MVFNSVVFLFCFLPLSLLLYYLVPGRAKNAVLLAESLLFYCWTGVAFLPLIAILIAFNYLWGLLTARAGTKLRGLLPLAAVLVNVVTAVFIPGVNDRVYRGFGYTIGSPNVWHNPTQQAVLVSALMVLPLLCHCWYEFERRYPEESEKTLLPWGEVILLAVFLMGSLACKPTFLQALLPAAFVMFLVELCRRPRCWRYFGQIVLAFVPAVAYFLLQYLYYTGVVVEYTSGVEFGVTLDSILSMLRSTVMMSVFPLYAIVCCYKKGMFKDRMLVLALLMVFFSLLEGMAFRETGLREGHGNFTWAANSSSFVLWVVMAGIFLREFVSGLKAKTLSSGRKVAYAVGFALMGWHAASGVYYLYFLLSTGNAF